MEYKYVKYKTHQRSQMRQENAYFLLKYHENVTNGHSQRFELSPC